MFCPAKHIDLLNPKIAAKVKQENEVFYITLSADAPAFFTELDLDNYDVIFSENCLYISPDKSVTVSINKNSVDASLTQEDVIKLLRIRSLYDTYE